MDLLRCARLARISVSEKVCTTACSFPGSTHPQSTSRFTALFSVPWVLSGRAGRWTAGLVPPSPGRSQAARLQTGCSPDGSAQLAHSADHGRVPMVLTAGVVAVLSDLGPYLSQEDKLRAGSGAAPKPHCYDSAL